MKSAPTTLGVASDARPPTTPRNSRVAAVNLTLAIVCLVFAMSISLVPAAQFNGWLWAALALLSVLALGCAYGVHRAAWMHIVHGVPHPYVLASTATLATYAWTAATIDSDDANQHVAVAAVVGLLVTVVHHVRMRNGTGFDDRAPRWLVPGMLALALATLAGWWIADSPSRAGSAAVAVLVVGCAAAVLLAAPSAVLTGMKRGTKLGMQFGGPATLDAAQRIDTIVLDKNQTVTTGDLTVVSVETLDPEHDRNVRWFAGALEHAAEDLVGRAIAKLAGRGNLTDVQHQAGLGVSGAVDRHPVRVGHPDWIGFDAHPSAGTTVAVEVDGRPLGCITVADEMQPHAEEAVSELRELELDVILVSDENLVNTEYAARHAGIDSHFAEQSDGNRTDLITTLQADDHSVAMVGDRDANPSALHAADLAISDTTAADDNSSSSLVLTSISASTVATAIALCRATLATMRVNHWIALAATLIPAPFAAAGLISPTIAALIVVVDTAAVAINSWRLRTPALHAHAD